MTNESRAKGPASATATNATGCLTCGSDILPPAANVCARCVRAHQLGLRARRDAAYRLPPLAGGHRDPMGGPR